MEKNIPSNPSYSANTFLLLGKTGTGKSTLSKILSENPNIKIGDSYSSETKRSTSYNCVIDNFHYSIIDTPGYDDSEGNDKINFEGIKTYLVSETFNIKGIILFFNFHDSRIGQSDKRGLEDIVRLIPLDNLWDYVTIIFTKSFSSDEDEFEEDKKKKYNSFKQNFQQLINDFYIKKGIKKVDFSQINTIFVDLKIKKTKKHDKQLQILIDILQKQSKLEPLFHKVIIETKMDQILINRNNLKNEEEFYNVKFKITKYYNKYGKIIKTISIPIEKKYIKKSTKTLYKEIKNKVSLIKADIKEIYEEIKFKISIKDFCKENEFKISAFSFTTFMGGLSIIAFCPPLGLFFLGTSLTSFGILKLGS